MLCPRQGVYRGQGLAQRATGAQMFLQSHLWLLSSVWNCKQYWDWGARRKPKLSTAAPVTQTLLQRSSFTWHSELNTLTSNHNTHTNKKKRLRVKESMLQHVLCLRSTYCMPNSVLQMTWLLSSHFKSDIVVLGTSYYLSVSKLWE